MDSKYFNNSDSKKRITELGHRGFVGGDSVEMWYSIGILQYHFLISQGLKHTDKFLDIGCGSLRAGIYTIPYLDPGNYFGIDAEPTLIAAGLEHEIPREIVELKRPVFSSNHNFDFSFCKFFDVAIAQSVFTHLTIQDISLCLSRLLLRAKASSRFYFTFFEGNSSTNQHQQSHANVCWNYSKEELAETARANGWSSQYIGSWNHPRDQMLMLLTPEV